MNNVWQLVIFVVPLYSCFVGWQLFPSTVIILWSPTSRLYKCTVKSIQNSVLHAGHCCVQPSFNTYDWYICAFNWSCFTTPLTRFLTLYSPIAILQRRLGLVSFRAAWFAKSLGSGGPLPSCKGDSSTSEVHYETHSCRPLPSRKGDSFLLLLLRWRKLQES